MYDIGDQGSFDSVSWLFESIRDRFKDETNKEEKNKLQEEHFIYCIVANKIDRSS